MTNVHFNNAYEDKNYIEDLSQSLSKVQLDALLNHISPRTQQKIHNMDLADTLVREYLLTAENDNAAPAAPDFPFPLIDFKNIPTPYDFPVQDGQKVELSAHDPNYYVPGQEPISIKQQYIDRINAKALEKMKQQEIDKLRKAEAQQLKESLRASMSDDVQRRKEEEAERKRLALQKKIDLQNQKLTNSQLRKQQEEEDRRRKQEERDLTRSQKEAARAAQIAANQSKKTKHSSEKSHDSPSSKSSVLSEIHFSPNTNVKSKHHNLVEISDLSEYLRWKTSKKCCDWRWCCLFLFLTLISLLLGLVFWFIYTCMCGYRSPIISSGSHLSDENSLKLYKQLGDLQSQIEKLKDNKGGNTYIDLKNNADYKAILQQLENLKSNPTADTSELKKKLVLLEGKIADIPKQSVNESYLQSYIDEQVNAQLNKILKDIQDTSESKPKLNTLNQLFDKFAIINSDIGSLITASSSKSEKKQPIQLTLERSFEPGKCWATTNPASMKYVSKRAFHAKYLVVGHPQAKFLPNGRETAPVTIHLQIRSPRSDDPLDTEETAQKLNEIQFVLDGPREQAFDLSKYGLDTNKNISGFAAQIFGQESTKNLCIYEFVILGEYSE